MLMGVSAEQQELRESVRRFLADRAPLPRVRELMETDHGTDAEVWRQAGVQLGLQGVAIPEGDGGGGLPFSRPGRRRRGPGARAVRPAAPGGAPRVAAPPPGSPPPAGA